MNTNNAFWMHLWCNGYGKDWYPRKWFYTAYNPGWFDYHFGESNSKRKAWR